MTGAARTLPQALESAAGSRAGLFYVAENGQEAFESYRALFDRARTIAGHLGGLGLKRGDNVAIIIPEAEGFVATLFGVSIAGLAAVPLAPPTLQSELDAFLESLTRLIRAADARAIVTTTRIRSILGTVQAASPSVRSVLAWEDLSGPAASVVADVRPGDIALIQFTSGSTSQPKGVVITHANLDANVSAIMGPGGVNASERDLGVSWLPLFHDMGLIGVVIGCLHACVSQALIPPLLFLKRPAEWLRAISRHRGTLSFAPNFAYELASRRVADRDIDGLDLSSWRTAGCGAEPIRARTLEEFSKKFARVGFKATSFLPCYGLAEHTLAASFHPSGQIWRVDTVQASALHEKQRAVPCREDGPTTVRIVSCGRPFPGHGVQIVGGDGRPCEERQVGEIALSGASVMQGYYRATDLSERAMRGGWLHTGDLGYLADGELYVCGRKKDLIIVQGRNYYPQDLEWSASEVTGVRKGSVVAFGTEGPDGTERVVIMVESKDPLVFGTLATDVRRRVQDTSGLHVHDVVVVPRGTIPKTTSGKLQRARARKQYETGEIVSVPPHGRRTILGHLVRSRWGYAVVVARKVTERLLRPAGRN